MYSEIYLVDDEDLVNTINTIHFRKLGLEHKIKSFTNPELALDDLRFKKDKSQRILILLDINMPEMTGFEFLEFMDLENFPTTYEVLMVTSSINSADKKKSEEYSRYVKNFISKPLRIEHLESFLQRSISVKAG
ncbi:hypothetical protein HME9304_02597 [Flagellimonas maritima]|uniref:Response regulatory domain-containing protein n=1 Tax=Flagellimonas maritima TaxID=1383885 RepID=A0A2Z4LUJ3_9FLAO|nr:response regulator [Allomuricauda aurantiaca]AWX45575.1 hypothetical protein HME9304_02597 [Allomuricauda aurantiaca]